MDVARGLSVLVRTGTLWGLQGQESRRMRGEEAELGKKLRQRQPACFNRPLRLKGWKWLLQAVLLGKKCTRERVC
jgi:hypothetical protein